MHVHLLCLVFILLLLTHCLSGLNFHKARQHKQLAQQRDEYGNGKRQQAQRQKVFPPDNVDSVLKRAAAVDPIDAEHRRA